jgi:hypothetical protein
MRRSSSVLGLSESQVFWQGACVVCVVCVIVCVCVVICRRPVVCVCVVICRCPVVCVCVVVISVGVGVFVGVIVGDVVVGGVVSGVVVVVGVVIAIAVGIVVVDVVLTLVARVGTLSSLSCQCLLMKGFLDANRQVVFLLLPLPLLRPTPLSRLSAELLVTLLLLLLPM